MYAVCVLRSKKFSRKFYIGFTSRKMLLRLVEHNYGSVEATRLHRPWELIYCEVYLSEEDARNRERKLKDYGSSWGHLKERLGNTLKT